MSDMNSVNLTGRLTRDVELRTIGSGTSVADLGLAVNDKKKQGDQWVDVTHFVDVTVWGRTAEIANEYASKGSKVAITGRLNYESWNDQQTGQKRNKIKVVCDKLTLLGGSQGGGQGAGGGSQGSSGSGSSSAEVPF